MDRRQISYQLEIHQLLLLHYDQEELKTLCLRLGVNYDDLPAAGRENKARELVLRLGRRGRLDELREIVIRDRPTAVWPEAPDGPWDQTAGHLHVAHPARPATTAQREDVQPVRGLEPNSLRAYHERLVETLSGSRWRLDSRFVELTLLLDQGPEAQDIRFAPDPLLAAGLFDPAAQQAPDLGHHAAHMFILA